jgi:CRP/FNR family cyclic AMP-dependent transcriptional regulator
MTAAVRAETGRAGLWPVAPAGRVALLDVDPDLAAAIPRERAGALRTELTAPVYRLARGVLPEPPARSPGEPHFGYLVLKGLLISEVAVCGRPTAELIGPSDLIRPWAPDEEPLLPCMVKWTVLEQALLAELGPSFASRVSGRPDVVETLLRRGVRRAQAVALQRSIASHVRVDVRVLAFLWHVAERFGVVTPGAVRINLPLTHSVLARLVGARRPTVTTALQRLIQLGYLSRDGRAFVLHGDAGAVAELESRSPSRDFALPYSNGDGAAPLASRDGAVTRAVSDSAAPAPSDGVPPRRAAAANN